MTELDSLIANAYASEGKQDDVNKVYLTLLRSTLYVPVEKNTLDVEHEDEEPFKPLFANVDGNYFMLAFDQIERLIAWAGDQSNLLDYVEITGKNVIEGISDQAFLVLNLGSEFYKEFSPDEIKRLKTIVSRINQLKEG